MHVCLHENKLDLKRHAYSLKLKLTHLISFISMQNKQVHSQIKVPLRLDIEAAVFFFFYNLGMCITVDI